MLLPHCLSLLHLIIEFILFVESLSIRGKRAASVLNTTNWELPIPYEISDEYDEEQEAKILKALKTFEDNTCVTFNRSGDGMKLLFEGLNDTDACNSQLGDKGNELIDGEYAEYQPLHLGKTCFLFSTIQHEIMHAFGFDHTQSRPDRDQYVTIIADEIHPNQTFNFDVLDWDNFDNYSMPYEYNSVMHYLSTTFSKDENTTVLIPKDEDYIASMGPNHGPTFYDWKAINIRYNCLGNCDSPIECDNGGYQDPVGCNACVCPTFYTGEYCEREVNLLDLTHLAEGDSVSLHYDAPSAYYKEDYETDDFGRYNKERHVIRSPGGTKINITIKKLEPAANECIRECFDQAVEIVDGDMMLVGKRFCCANRTGHSFVSKTNVIGYQVYSTPGWAFSSKVTFSIVPAEEEATTDPDYPDEKEPVIPDGESGIHVGGVMGNI